MTSPEEYRKLLLLEEGSNGRLAELQSMHSCNEPP